MKQLRVEYVPVETIKTYKNNAKIHTNEQISQIAESIKAFGFNDPIAIDENNVIIEGHGRLLAAKQLMLYEVPVIRIEGLNEQQKKAYILAHNQLTLNTEFDLEILEDEINRIVDFDMTDFGFDMSVFLDDVDENNNDENEENKDEKENKIKTIKCPYCGEIISL